MTWKISTGGQELSFFSIMSMLGTPLDVTLAELTLEMFFPADSATQEFLEVSADRSGRRTVQRLEPAGVTVAVGPHRHDGEGVGLRT